MYQGLSLEQAPPEDIPFRFFLTAPFFGILAGLMILILGKELFLTGWSFETIILTHMITLGWLAQIMFGAFYQMVPVLVGGSVPFIPLSRLVHGLLLFGTIFLGLGLWAFREVTLIIAVGMLGISLGIFVVQILIALFRVKGKGRPTILGMKISVICLALTGILGISFVGNLAGWWYLPFSRSNMIGIHIYFGLFGWVGTLIMGVGFHMIPMFYLAPAFAPRTGYNILILHLIGLILAPLALIFDLENYWVYISALPSVVAAGWFIFSVFRLLKKRKRRLVDSTIRFWQSGLILLGVSILFLLVQLWIPDNRLVLSFGFLFLAGFGMNLTNGMLYKIVPFLIWFHRFSSQVGKPGVPLMKDIQPDKPARIQWMIFTVSLPLLWAAILFQNDILARAGGAVLILSTLFFLWNLSRAYRLKLPKELQGETPEVPS